MADTIIKPKLQLRSGPSVNGEKTPSPSPKLLINHGKPNFTIQRSPKVQSGANGGAPHFGNGHANNNGNSSTTSTTTISSSSNNNYYAFKTAQSSLTVTNNTVSNNNNGNGEMVVRSTKFNGAFKPTSLSLKQSHQLAGQKDNEAAKVVLRRAKVAGAEPAAKRPDEDDGVPEFIRRQRRIQERLAKENLDFENRRSGYFTQVMLSPTSPNRTSFMETMSSPAVVPSLELHTPVVTTRQELLPEEHDEELADEVQVPIEYVGVDTNGHGSNGVDQIEEEEEEVAKAIEEVNKAVEGEEDVDVGFGIPIEVTRSHLFESNNWHPVEAHEDEAAAAAAEEEEEVVHAAVAVTTLEMPMSPVENGHAAAPAVQQNGGEEAVTISHANSMAGPSIPTPDPSGALGVNYEPKTVVSFSHDLSREPNKYPDTVKVVREGETTPAVEAAMQEFAKLKFDISTDQEDDVQVTPVLRTVE